MKLIFEHSSRGRRGSNLPACSIMKKELPRELLRERPAGLPEVSEGDVVRHFTGLSQRNIGVDANFYPLGSCTMKYNPKVNEDMAALPGFTGLHPYLPESAVQGALALMYELERLLGGISGMDNVTLQPAAGAHGELTGLLIAAAYHRSKGAERRTVLVPDTAHGTNPASAHLAGYHVVPVASRNGNIDLEDLKKKLDKSVAVFMVTNPNTLGIFEKEILKVADMVHSAGALLYMDGANLNALMGIARPGDFGVDIMHFNLHKTFSSPHGGGGPGSGPVGVKAFLKDFLPVPVIMKEGNSFRFEYGLTDTIGKMKAFYGNFGVMVRAYTYLVSMGNEGVKRASELAVLNANYLKERLKDDFTVPYDVRCKHEFVITASPFKEKGVRALDIAKRLLDFGIHPPTIYFPLIVDECLMIEPTETESKESLDGFIEVMKGIRKEIDEDPDVLKNAPVNTPVKRVDEVRAARDPKLAYRVQG